MFNLLQIIYINVQVIRDYQFIWKYTFSIVITLDE